MLADSNLLMGDELNELIDDRIGLKIILVADVEFPDEISDRYLN